MFIKNELWHIVINDILQFQILCYFIVYVYISFHSRFSFFTYKGPIMSFMSFILCSKGHFAEEYEYTKLLFIRICTGSRKYTNVHSDIEDFNQRITRVI